MATSIRDILTAFSPSLDFFAISSGDGRIKIWDTVKGQIQTEFADVVASDDWLTKSERGHLSVDYKCMKWLSLDKEKKRKLGYSLLVLGTGSGDVLAFDVAAGQLKWRISDCHPGGVSAIAFPASGSCIYSAGADGMVCEIDSLTGNQLRKFRASTKAISCMAVSSDGKTLATAAGQLKTFNCSTHKKLQKFSGHPGAVRCMIFTEDGRYIVSSSVGERYVAVWRTDGGKKQSATCVLAMEHPAVFLDSRSTENGVPYVFAITETGVGYLWYGLNVEELRNAKPTKVSVSLEDMSWKGHRSTLPTIFAAKLQGITKPSSICTFLAYGLIVKPSFQKIIVDHGTDLMLNSSQSGILLPMSQPLNKSKHSLDVKTRVTALDRAYAEDALLPIPKIFDHQDKNDRHQSLGVAPDEVMVDLIESRNQATSADDEGAVVEVKADSKTLCMEDQLRSSGLLDDCATGSAPESTVFKSINLEEDVSQKKMKATVCSIAPGDACKLLEDLMALWYSRSYSGKHILAWIYSILVNHSHHIISQEPLTQKFNSMLKMMKSRGSAIQPLLELSGRLQLLTSQIDMAAGRKTWSSANSQHMEESEDEDNDADEVNYGEDGESELSSDDDN